MRAFMSDRSQRIPLGFTLCMGSDDPRLIVEDAQGRMTTESAPLLAQREALRILRESEPEPTHAEMVAWGGRPSRIHTSLSAMRKTAGASPYSLRDELAEALAGFVKGGK